MVYDVLGVALLLRPAAHQVSPLVEDALQAGLGQPLTCALEEGTMLVLPLGSPLPTSTCQCKQHSNVVSELSFGKSQIQSLHVRFGELDLKNGRICCFDLASAMH